MYTVRRKVGPASRQLFAVTPSSTTSITSRRCISHTAVRRAQPHPPNKDHKVQELQEELQKLGEQTAKVSSSVGKADFHVVEDQHSKTAEHHDHHHDEHHHHAEPVNEPLGQAFYIFLFAFPISIAIYTLSRPSEDGKIPVFTNLMRKYADLQQHWEARNTLHTTMVEQAAIDRHLFEGAKPKTSVDLRFNEIFNTGSPYNLSAGQQPRAMEQLVEFYERKNREQQERVLAKMAARSTQQ